jgi:phage terminase small subunit
MLSFKHKKFCLEYLIDNNATRSAKKAGFSEKTAYSQGQRLLKNVEVKDFIKKRQDEMVAEIKLDQITTLKEIQKRAFFDPRKFYREDGSLKSPCELEDTEAAALAEVGTVRQSAGRDEEGKVIFETVDKIKFSDKDRALDLLATIQGLKIEKSEVDLTGEFGVIRLPAKKPVGAPVDGSLTDVESD